MKIFVVQCRGYRSLVRSCAGLDRTLVPPNAQSDPSKDQRAPASIPEGSCYGVVRPMRAVVLKALQEAEEKNVEMSQNASS